MEANINKMPYRVFSRQAKAGLYLTLPLPGGGVEPNPQTFFVDNF